MLFVVTNTADTVSYAESRDKRHSMAMALESDSDEVSFTFISWCYVFLCPKFWCNTVLLLPTEITSVGGNLFIKKSYTE